jgi:hypothetical protein
VMWRLFAIVFGPLALAAAPCFACPGIKYFNPSDAHEAGIVFIGKVTDFQPIGGSHYGLFSIDLIEPLKGEMQDTITLIGPSYIAADFPLPSNQSYNFVTEPTVFAAFESVKQMPFAFVSAGSISDTFLPDLPVIGKAPCSYAWIRPAEPDFVAEIKRALIP